MVEGILGVLDVSQGRALRYIEKAFRTWVERFRPLGKMLCTLDKILRSDELMLHTLAKTLRSP
jgi:hypothetical protein